jgi:hypothetical protein
MSRTISILGQAGDRLLVLGAAFIGEHFDRRLGGRAGRRAINLPKVCLHVDLDREGDLVQHVGGLVNPTPLMPGAGKDLLDGLPEAERGSPKGPLYDTSESFWDGYVTYLTFRPS